MGSKKQSKAEEEEGKIPVLTVLKNNAILKNIFIVNKPPEEKESREDHEDVLLVGRHPDCDLMLTHPSISRFHLQIRSKPSSRTFSVLDLSSVHGTWVSGRKIEPMVSAEMKEGDTLRIGVSSRVYRLHWIPISRAYDLENPFVSNLDVVVEEEEGEEEEKEKSHAGCCLIHVPASHAWWDKTLNSCPVEKGEIELVDSILEDISSLFLYENAEVTFKEEILLAAEMLEDMVSLCCEEESKSPSKEEAIGEHKLCDSLDQVLVSVVECEETLTENFSETAFLPAVEDVLGTKEQQLHIPPDTFTSPLPGLEISFEKHDSSLHMNIAPASLDEEIAAEAVIMHKESESKSTLRDDGSVTDAFTAGTGIFNCESMFLRACWPAVQAVLGTKEQQFHIHPGTSTSPLPPDLENSFEKHDSSLLMNITPASLDEKNAAEAVIMPKQSESECTLRGDGRVTDAFTIGAGIFNYESMFLRACAFTAGAGIFNSESMFLPAEEAMSGTKIQQIEVVEEVALDSPSDREKQDMYRSPPQLLNDKFCHDRGHSLDEIIQDIGNKHTSSISPTSSQIESVSFSMPQEAVLNITNENHTLHPDVEIFESSVKAMEKNSINHNIWSRRGKATSAPQVRTSKSTLKSTANVDNEVAISNEKDIANNTISKNLLSVLNGELEVEEEEMFTPDKENFSPNTLRLRFMKKGKLEEIKHSKSKRSRNSKSKFNPDIYPNESIGLSLSKKNQKDMINKTISKDLFSVLDGEEEVEEEIFTPDKENFRPNTLQLQLLKKGKVEELKCSKSPWPQNTKDNFGHNIYLGENMSPTSNKENQTPKGAQDQKLQRKPFSSHIKLAQEQDVMTFMDRVERVPFQSLKSSGGKRKSGTLCPVSPAKSFDLSNCGQILDQHINPSDISGVQKKRWDMIVDTASLLSKESRNALQLLQGLKGTRLIIPRLVIRELNTMKRQFTIFRRISEASLALEWIEECMVKTNWWIHIQSSMEEGELIAPTPPASPQTQFNEENWTFLGGNRSLQPPSHKGSMEISSPTVEDHILDFALLYRKKQIDGQLVLLSEDVTVKIKCMAEGLVCEPVQEFRESLVNPFSERFLWKNSSPRGLTWSCQDDVVLREKYCRLPLRKSSKGVASGLKLILLHNSQYRH
ncbi:hypothetical protein VNO77_34021 [Canavalia gladiata]|uniref:FHA domain-containing protein n=1 Tax=Canavalia gladiata TaxID=3824 RepID=A0AAN9KG11_CANGL